MSSVTRILVGLCALGLGAAPARAEDFYRGRTITFSTFAAPGGSYDAYLRLLAQHIGKYIPGQPAIVVTNQPGAGGLTAANYAGRIAPRDGTFLSLISLGLIVQEATGAPGLQTSLKEFNWIGNFAKDNNVVATRANFSVKTIEDAKRTETILGSLGAGSIDAQLPAAYNQLLGAKFKILPGYEGTPQVMAAMERGEVDGKSNTWASFKSLLPNGGALRLNVLLQTGFTRDPELAHVPLLVELARGDEVREGIARFLTLSTMISRPLAAPPGVPADRVGILRRAFDATMKDPEFRAMTDKAGFNIDPMTGEETQDAIAQILSTPSNVVVPAKQMLEARPQ